MNRSFHIGVSDVRKQKQSECPLPIGLKKRVYDFFKDELGRKTRKEFVALRAKTFGYLTDDDSEKKKAKGTKKCVIKHKLVVENYKDFLSNGELY